MNAGGLFFICITVLNSQSTNTDSIDAWTAVKSYIYFLYKFIESCEITVETFAGTVVLCAGAPIVLTKLATLWRHNARH